MPREKQVQEWQLAMNTEATRWLGEWVDDRHFTTEAVDDYCTQFDQHEARVLCVDGFLRAEVAKRCAEFLKSEAYWKVSYGLWDGQDVGVERWKAAPINKRFFRFQTLDLGRGELRPSANFFAYISTQNAMSDPRFATFFSSLCKRPLELSKLDVHGMRAGDFLAPHSDRGGRRRLAFIVYLSPDYQPEWGGVLRIIHRSGATSSFAPKFNRLVVFDVEAHWRHLVEKIESPAEDSMRISLGGWFSEIGAPSHLNPEV